jgi:predicted nucleotidyltransferase
VAEHPTSDRELNAVLHELVGSVQAILGENLIGAYLQGSFAVGDWDVHSDVDFVVATTDDLSDAELSALQALHGRIYDRDSHWAQHLEGSYIPAAVLKRHDPANTPLWFLDNTHRALARSTHDNTLVVRWVVREYGIPLAGPHPHTLVDPVPADDLRREVAAKMDYWAQLIFADPKEMDNRWYQPYAVLSYCRMLHTLETARIVSKLTGARWAQSTLDPRWAGLIERAWAERPHPALKIRQKADPDDFELTLAFIRYALDLREHYAGIKLG